MEQWIRLPGTPLLSVQRLLHKPPSTSVLIIKAYHTCNNLPPARKAKNKCFPYFSRLHYWNIYPITKSESFFSPLSRHQPLVKKLEWFSCFADSRTTFANACPLCVHPRMTAISIDTDVDWPMVWP